MYDTVCRSARAGMFTAGPQRVSPAYPVPQSRPGELWSGLWQCVRTCVTMQCSSWIVWDSDTTFAFDIRYLKESKNGNFVAGPLRR